MRVFAQVVEQGSFTEAARHLNVTVSQVSRAVGLLEAHLRARLLHRTTRRIALTDAGERYLERCEQIIAHIDEAEAEAGQAHIQASGRLRVHATTSFGQSYVVPAIVQYQTRFPAVVVDMRLSQDIPDLLEDGYDVSLRLSPGALPDSGQVARALGTVSSVLCASRSYLARHGEPGSIADLSQHACLPLVSSVFPHERWDFTGPDGIQTFNLPRTMFRTNVPEALAAAVRGGAGIGILPMATALAGMRDGSLVQILGEYRLQQLDAFVVYTSSKFVDAKIRTFVDALRELIPKALSADDAALRTFSSDVPEILMNPARE
jgi:DNA-binding transcriptional LysR family regulator